MSHIRFIQPLDVLFLRGNRLFGGAGSYGESVVPPWPSVAAGALRSHHFAETGKALDDPDDFRIVAFHLARRSDRVEGIYALPADLAITGERGSERVSLVRPVELFTGVQCSSPTAKVPTLAQDDRSKPASGYWLKASGWQRYLAGELPGPNHLVHSSQLWKLDHRVGVGLDAEKRRAEDGKLFSMQAIAFEIDVGFLTVSKGNVAPATSATLRLGGDGRGAALSAVDAELPLADYAAIAAARRARIVLTTPGIFLEGWRLPGMHTDGHFELRGLRARVVAAAVPRAEVVSGWDMVNRLPKNAQRVVPTGSVYWLEDIEASTETLCKLADHGLWPENNQDIARRIEGFNHFAFAAY